MAYHLVRLTRGPAWDPDCARREQTGWAAHAAYMDRLADHGVVVLGGPVGDCDTGDAVLVVHAFDQAAALAMLAGDPWLGSVLAVETIEPWTIWLRAPAAADAVLAG
jgi:uncharacterized protein YciI